MTPASILDRFQRAAGRVMRTRVAERSEAEKPSVVEEREETLRHYLSLPAARSALLPSLASRISELEALQSASFKDHATMLLYQGALVEVRRFRALVERHLAGQAGDAGPRQ